MTFLIILRLLFCLFCCNRNFNYATPIIGNTRTAKFNEFPFIVSISHSDNATFIGTEENNHICGGTLVSKKYVLTAAHCFSYVMAPQDIIVKTKSVDLRDPEIFKYRVSWYIFYKQWAKNISKVNTYHDVAIVKIRKSGNSVNLSPVKLATHEDDVYYGKQAIVAGWGRIQNNVRSRLMHTGEVTVLTQDQCLFNQKKFKDPHALKNYVPGTLLCSQASPPVLFRCGDSGGPLLFNETIIGINLGGCAKDGYAPLEEQQNYHASINYYKEFILDVVDRKHMSMYLLNRW